MQKLVIAIDGYSSCGKSTFAKAIAARLGYVFVDSGAMYRAVTLFALEQGLFLSDGGVDESALRAAMNGIDIHFRFSAEKGRSETYLNGVCVEDQIRTLEVSSKVSSISALAFVREYLVKMQQKMGEEKGIVMDGRDIGTTVFPNADLKIFMTASSQVRAQRRYDELKAKGMDVSLQEIENNLLERDRMDTERKVSPLRRADDAVLLDNSALSVEEQMAWVMRLIRARQS